MSSVLRDVKREKLLNSIIYFVENTKYCQKTKLFKLLYLLDFEHFKEAGRSVTGLDYFAWELGPVPKELNNEFSSPLNDFTDKIEIENDELDNGFIIKPKEIFNSKIFSKRELRILEKIASENVSKLSKEMVKLTHTEDSPWDITFNKLSAKNAKIDYDLILKGLNPDDASIVRGIASDLLDDSNEFESAFIE